MSDTSGPMGATTRTVERLASESSDLEAAIETVLDVADDKGVVTWGDVSDDISSGTWGRLIEEGVLVDADGSGFVIGDPDGVREALDDADEPDDDEEESSWTVYDKAALVAIVPLFIGYSWEPMRNAVGTVMDVPFGFMAANMPFYLVIMVMATLTGLYSALLQDNLAGDADMSEQQEKMKELKERRKRAKERGDDEALKEIQQEQMEAMDLSAMKSQMRPMPWIMVLTIPVFLWLYYQVGKMGTPDGPVAVFPIVGEVASWEASIVGPILVWFFWYFLCSMSFGQILRKALNVQTGA
nr:DUF106 domain-containing protein [Halococcoides cellulosivorans]